LRFFIALAISPFILQWANDFHRASNPWGLIAFLSNRISWRDRIRLGVADHVGLLSGIYPAFVISAFKPSTILEGNHCARKAKAC
jgi:hypothetical protein